MDITARIFVAILAAAIIAFVAYRSGALTRSGAFAATLIGAATFAAAGWTGALVLFSFFIPSMLLSRIGHVRKRSLVDIGKHGARDAWQVFANGGVATVSILAFLRFGSPLAAAFAGAFAAAAGDTWGTEIGTLLKQRPRSILTLRPIATGISGGVTVVGTLATIGGASIVALTSMLAGVAPFWPVAVAGVAGALIDSLAGASAQALRYCPTCSRDCETNPHVCGTATTLRRGLGWFENDAVNLAATLSGAAIAALLTVFSF